MSETPEGCLVKSIIHYLALKRYFCWRNNTGGFRDKRDHFYTFGKVGSGDILGLTHLGRFFSIEAKVKGKLPTDHQKEFMKRVNESGGLAFTAYSLDDVIAKGL